MITPLTMPILSLQVKGAAFVQVEQFNRPRNAFFLKLNLSFFLPLSLSFVDKLSSDGSSSAVCRHTSRIEMSHWPTTSPTKLFCSTPNFLFFSFLSSKTVNKGLSFLGWPHRTVGSVLALRPVVPGLILGVPDCV